MAATTLFTFAELEFLLRSAASGTTASRIEAIHERLQLPADAVDVVVAAGVASLLARELCTENAGDVVPGQLVAAAVAALSTAHTLSQAAGWIDRRPVVVHLIGGTAARMAVSPGSYGLFGVEVINPAEPLARPLQRFVDQCTAGDGETAVVIRSAPIDGGPETGLAVARTTAGEWLLSDTADRPDQGRPASRTEVAARLGELFGSAVGA
jgi:hypothetical protein